MAELIEWERPSGTTIETNDFPATIAHCKKLGWKQIGKSKVKSKAKAKAKGASGDPGIDALDTTGPVAEDFEEDSGEF